MSDTDLIEHIISMLCKSGWGGTNRENLLHQVDKIITEFKNQDLTIKNIRKRGDGMKVKVRTNKEHIGKGNWYTVLEMYGSSGVVVRNEEGGHSYVGLEHITENNLPGIKK